MHHFVTEMCTHMHISVTKWCIVGYGTGALWDLSDRSIQTTNPVAYLTIKPLVGLNIETGPRFSTYMCTYFNWFSVRLGLNTTNGNPSWCSILRPEQTGRYFADDIVMTSSNGNGFHVTGPLWGESTGDQWIPSQRASGAGFCVFFDVSLNKRLNKQTRRGWFETSRRPLRRHCSDIQMHFVERKPVSFVSIFHEFSKGSNWQ